MKLTIKAHIQQLKDELDALPKTSENEIAEKKYELRFFEAYLDSFFA